MNPISALAGLLALCGISSVRMFAPVFLFGMICRFLPGYSWCPSEILGLAQSCPPFLTSTFGLIVFGVLGALEVVANWDDSLREMISETNIDTYAKPIVALLLSYSIFTPEQAQVLSSAVSGVMADVDAQTITNAVVSAASENVGSGHSLSGVHYSALFSSLFCCGGTFGLCRIRARIASAVRELDPDNALHLNTLLTLFEEGSWLTILPLLLVFPFLALVLMLILGFFGWLLFRPIKRVAMKRRAYWDAVGMDCMLKSVRNRAILIFGLGVLVSMVPVFGYLATVVALNFLVFGVIALYEKPSSRIIAKLVMRFVKLTLLLMAIAFSCIPFMGILLLLPYAVSYFMRVGKIKHLRNG